MVRYEEIARDMRHQLMLGKWGDEGQQIPTVAELMELYDVTSSQTIRSAQAVLITEGLLQPRQGRGVFISRRPSAEHLGVQAAREAIDVASQSLVEASTALTGLPLPLRLRIDYNGREGVFAGSGSRSAQILCEVCGRAITQDAPGIVTMPPGDSPRTVSVRFVHKITCDIDQDGSWEDLHPFLMWLVRGLDAESALEGEEE